jgi:hypothetical protein
MRLILLQDRQMVKSVVKSVGWVRFLNPTHYKLEEKREVKL